MRLHRETSALPAAAAAVWLLAAVAFGSSGCRSGPAPSGEAAIGVRNAHAMAYDAETARVILFGGADAERVHGDTWAWDGAEWRLVTREGPGPRTFPALAFDEARGELVLFGGNRVLFGRDDEWDTLYGDTWVLRDGRWQVRDGRGPSPRAEAAMAYDPRRQRIVLFGGYERTADGRVRLGDTWEWDGARWTLAATTGPAPRNGAVMAYDDEAGRVILTGGPPAFVEAGTWAWDGADWRSLPPPAPPGRFNPAMAYLGARRSLVLFGGWTGATRSDETWVRDEDGWRQLPVAGPPARNHAGFASDVRRSRAVLFGGHDGERVFGDTWEFDGDRWVLRSTVPPEVRADNHH